MTKAFANSNSESLRNKQKMDHDQNDSPIWFFWESQALIWEKWQKVSLNWWTVMEWILVMNQVIYLLNKRS